MDIRKFSPLRAASPSQRQGRKAEETARAWLEAKGLMLVAANYHCRYGELDLVMKDRNMLVFVEVRERAASRFGGAAASVTRAKQEKIIATAQHFLQHRPEFRSWSARFDVLALDRKNTDVEIQWLQAAFAL